MEETSWKLEELARRSGVSGRTVRYYVQRGLLPAPVFRGRDTTYNEAHLYRLQAIRKLQERFLPLDAIESELAKLSAEQIRKLAEGVQESEPSMKGHPYREPPAFVLPQAQQLQPREEKRWARWEIAPGLEIHVSEAADAMTRALAEELRAMARKLGGSQ